MAAAAAAARHPGSVGRLGASTAEPAQTPSGPRSSESAPSQPRARKALGDEKGVGAGPIQRPAGQPGQAAQSRDITAGQSRPGALC